MARFRFYGQLNDFLPWQFRHGRFTHSLRGPASVKDVIEALGVPHPEVDVIVVNGLPADLTHRMRDDDEVAVYPVFHSVDISGLRRVGVDPPPPVRFVLDVICGSLLRCCVSQDLMRCCSQTMRKWHTRQRLTDASR